MHPNPRRIIPVVLLLAATAAAVWYFNNISQANAEIGALAASGTIEATKVLAAAEVGGQIVEVAAREGETVQAGQVLVRFDGALLQAQLAQAEAALGVAKANYDLVSAGTPVEQRQAAITAAELELESARQARQSLFDTADLARAQAEQQVADAAKALDKAEDRVDSIQGESDPEDIERAEAQVVITRDALKKAQEDYDRVYKYYKLTNNKNVGRAYQQIKLANAQDAYDHAVTVLNNLLGHANELDLAVAEANVKVAAATLADAQRELEKVKDGPDAEALALAEARLSAAEAGLAAAQAQPAQEQLTVAQQQMEVSQAAVDVLQAQVEKLVVAAPFAGVVTTLKVRQGEWVNPGTSVLLLADLGSLRVETTDLNEIDAARLRQDDPVKVTFDALPGVNVNGTVWHVADKSAEGSGVNYTVVIELNQIPVGLLWGMTAFVDIEVDEG